MHNVNGSSSETVVYVLHPVSLGGTPYYVGKLCITQPIMYDRTVGGGAAVAVTNIFQETGSSLQLFIVLRLILLAASRFSIALISARNLLLMLLFAPDGRTGDADGEAGAAEALYISGCQCTGCSDRSVW
jgi:hypothetical protein